MRKLKPNIWVTGSNSQLARCIKDEMNTFSLGDVLFTTKEEVDITSESAVKYFLKDKEIQFCINTAAYTAVDKAQEENEKAFFVNAEGVKILAEACKEFRICLIHVSTDFVFDGKKQTPYLENDRVNPINVYGSSKLKGEINIQKIIEEHFIVRTSWLYSAYGKNFVKTMLWLGKEKEEVNVISDQYGSPTYALDLAKFLLFLTVEGNKNFGLYHFSNEGEISWYEFAKAILKRTAPNCKVNAIKSCEYKSLATRPLYTNLSLEKIKKEFAYVSNPWGKGLEDCLKKLGY